MSDVMVNGTTLDQLDEDGRNAVFDRLQAQMPQVWTAMRRDDPRESVVVVPSMTLDRVVTNTGGMSQALEERFLFFLLPAAPAAAADGLRHLAADQPAGRRLLPLAAARGDPGSRAVAALPRLGRRLRPRSR